MILRLYQECTSYSLKFKLYRTRLQDLFLTTIGPSTLGSTMKPKSSRKVKPKSSAASLKAATNEETSTVVTSRSGSLGKSSGKTLSEVVATSVEGEKNV
jgi:hypothetical protein